MIIRIYSNRIILVISALMLSMSSSLAIALCSEEQKNKAAIAVEEAMSSIDEIDRVLLLKRSLKVCPNFSVWLELGTVELATDNFIDAAYALENARDFHLADVNNEYSREQILSKTIANSWLAETYHRDGALALAIVATQEATSGYELLGQSVPVRLIELQAEIDDAMAGADATVITRSLSLQHNRASRGIGVQSRIRTQSEPIDAQSEAAQLLAEYSGDTTPVTAAVETATAPPSDILPAATAVTESRLNIPVLFEFDSDQLSSDSVNTVGQLGAAIEALNLLEKDSVLIIGHTDSQGNEAYNLALSQRRADSVLRKIQQITTISAELLASGQGEAELRYKGNNSDDHRRNRRVEMVIRR